MCRPLPLYIMGTIFIIRVNACGNHWLLVAPPTYLTVSYGVYLCHELAA